MQFHATISNRSPPVVFDFHEPRAAIAVPVHKFDKLFQGPDPDLEVSMLGPVNHYILRGIGVFANIEDHVVFALKVSVLTPRLDGISFRHWNHRLSYQLRS